MSTTDNSQQQKSLKALLQNPKLRFGGYASIITFAVIVGVIVINLLIAQLDVQIDMTEHDVYTLSDQTRKVLDNLDDDVTIYVLARRSEEPAQVMEALRRYEQASFHIRIETVDADANPGFVAQYAEDGENPGNGNIIVASARNFRKISIYDLYSIDTRNPQQPVIMGLNVERRVTNALLYVATGTTPIIYQTVGRGEPMLDQVPGITDDLASENYEIRSVNLIQAPQVPEDGDVLLMFGISEDISEGEAQKVRDFLQGGGNLVIMADISSVEFPVLNDVLSGYGLRLDPGVVIEGDQNHHTGNPVQIYPVRDSHPITDPIIEARRPILIPGARPMRILDQKPRGVSIEPLLETTDESYLRTDFQSRDLERIPSDQPGPFVVAAAAIDTDFSSNAEISRIVVIGSASFLGPIMPYGYVQGNRDLAVNAIGWVQNQEELSIRSKTTLQFPMQLTAVQLLIFAGLFLVIIPLGILVAGLVVWLRRRHL